ncbi:MAG TPA: class I SAM-dependent methyltransferase family protein [archaeon]|nr:class I SAM-dependent methyltransferase family protein [archaeon]
MKQNLRALLAKILTDEEMQFAPNSFELVGSDGKVVAIVEIPEELDDRKAIIGKTIMHTNKSVKSVLNKATARKGEFRTREYELIAGNPETEVLHKEHGYLLKVNPQKTYFSAREGTERQRIAQQVERGEVVMVFFAGVGAYAIAIASEQPDVGKIITIEINPDAVEYAKQNTRINRIADKVKIIHGDVRKEAVHFYGECDRVVMPLPLFAANYLEDAIRCLREKTGGVVHFYAVVEEGDFPTARNLVEEACVKMKKKCKILNEHKITEYSPRKWKVCIDFQVS